MQIQGSIALVTGANGGIGRQFVDGLRAANAAKIYVCARSLAKLDPLVALDPERIVPIELEVTNLESVQAAAAKCSDVTLLINNAGISLNQAIIAADSLDSARAELEVNYFGLINMCRAFAPSLKANGGGTIVNTLSAGESKPPLQRLIQCLKSGCTFCNALCSRRVECSRNACGCGDAWNG